MNLSFSAKRILCYGDSNTWGYMPKVAMRYPVNQRWTGILQSKLGNDFWILEEGQNGRTTNLDDPQKPGKNGWTYLLPCIETHNPIDVFILALGTNDLKERYHRSPNKIAEVIEQYILTVKKMSVDQNGQTPTIILCSPPIVDESVEGVEEKYRGAEEKSKQLGALYQQVAVKQQIDFLDWASIVRPSKKDGYHLEPDAHQKIADELYAIIKKKCANK